MDKCHEKTEITRYFGMHIRIRQNIYIIFVLPPNKIGLLLKYLKYKSLELVNNIYTNFRMNFEVFTIW